MDYDEIGARFIDKAQSKGVEESEVYLFQNRILDICFHNTTLEKVQIAQPAGFALRIINNKRLGFAYGTGFEEEIIDRAIDKAIQLSRHSDLKEGFSFPLPSTEKAVLDIYDPAFMEKKQEEKLKITEEIARQALSSDQRIKTVITAAYYEKIGDNYIVNSHGLKAFYQATKGGNFLYVKAEDDGDSQTGYAESFHCFYNKIDPQKVVTEAVKQATNRLGAQRISTVVAPVILSPKIFSTILNYFSPAFSAEYIHKGKSLLREKLGEQIGSQWVNIIDNGRLPQGLGSSPVDAEGSPTREKQLVEKGILKNYLSDKYYAYLTGDASTGNAVRHSFRQPPRIGTTNLYLVPGQICEEELIGQTEQGLYITEILNAHTINPVSGDFSVGAAGIWIKRGEFAYPVTGVAIAGNFLDFLSQIDCVANNLQFFITADCCGSPTVRVTDITISGD